MSTLALDEIRIARPCDASWEDMEGTNRVRFCGSCRKHVYNLTALSREAAQALLDETEAGICVRLYQRADGTVVSSDCGRAPPPAPRTWARLGGGLAAAFGLMAGTAMIPQPAEAAVKKPVHPASPSAGTIVMGEPPVAVVRNTWPHVKMGKVARPVEPAPAKPEPR